MFMATVGSFLFERILFRARRIQPIRDLHVNQVVGFQGPINEPEMGVSARHLIMVGRSPRYLNWRYSAPGQKYCIFLAETAAGIRGYVVLQRRRVRGIRIGHIIDLLAESEEVMHALVSTVIEYCRLDDADMVVAHQIARDNGTCRTLKKSGFMWVPWTGRLTLVLVAYAVSPAVPNCILADPENWLVQIGDSDIKDVPLS
jgi:hypothetical protein